jgi:hypothetical protein
MKKRKRKPVRRLRSKGLLDDEQINLIALAAKTKSMSEEQAVEDYFALQVKKCLDHKPKVKAIIVLVGPTGIQTVGLQTVSNLKKGKGVGWLDREVGKVAGNYEKHYGAPANCFFAIELWKGVDEAALTNWLAKGLALFHERGVMFASFVSLVE